MRHWAERYIGQPWVAGAQGPEAWDCWALARHVLAAHYGVEVPLILAADYDDEAELVALFTGHAERARWARVAEPRDGDLVLVRRPLHAGIWLDVDGGGVLAAVRGAGVVFTRAGAWATSGFGRRVYYRRPA